MRGRTEIQAWPRAFSQATVLHQVEGSCRSALPGAEVPRGGPVLSENARGAWQETTVHSFGCTAGDGSLSLSGVISDSAGNLYGTAGNGEASGDRRRV